MVLRLKIETYRDWFSAKIKSGLADQSATCDIGEVQTKRKTKRYSFVSIMTKNSLLQGKLIRAGAIVCGLSVLLGALGAHALESQIHEWYKADSAARKLASWDTAVRYQMIHGLALLVTGWLCSIPGRTKVLHFASVFFITGILVFSGGLILWVLTDWKPFVHVVPLGGVSLVLGWFSLAFYPCRIPTDKPNKNQLL